MHKLPERMKIQEFRPYPSHVGYFVVLLTFPYYSRQCYKSESDQISASRLSVIDLIMEHGNLYYYSTYVLYNMVNLVLCYRLYCL